MAGGAAPQGPEVLRVDLTGANAARKTTFEADGLAVQVISPWTMIGRTTVRIEATLPEAGQFHVELSSPSPQVEVRNVSTAGKQGTAILAARYTLMSLADADRLAREAVNRVWEPFEQKARPEADRMNRDQLHAWLREHNVEIPQPPDKQQETELCRRAYRNARVLETIGPTVRARLNEIAERKPQWCNAHDHAAMEKMNSRELLDAFEEQTKFELMDQYLKGLDLGIETTRTGYRTRLTVRLEAAHQILSGRTARGSASVASGLTPTEQARLRAAVSGDVVCRFFPGVDPEDPNSQWFNGQRTACRGKGIASIRLEGRLAPGKHDRVDWWLLEGYDPRTVQLDYPRNAGYRVDPPLVVEGSARLRVAATQDKPVDYSVELRPVPATSGAVKVVVHESPTPRDRKFPY